VNSLSPQPLRLSAIAHVLGAGWRHFRAMPGPSLTLGGLITLLGVALLLIPFFLGVPAVALIIAGGMALIAPLFLPLFLGLRQARVQGERPRLGHALSSNRRLGTGFWALAGACGFLLLVWITDAGILYAFMVRAVTPGEPVAAGPLAGAGAAAALDLAAAGAPTAWANPGIRSFLFWASLMGAVLAAGVHLIAGFSVPLLQEGRATIVPAIHASVRTVFGNLIPTLTWGLILVLGLVLGFLLPPLMALVAPVLAYSQYEFYRLAFPVTSPATRIGPDPGPASTPQQDWISGPIAPQPGGNTNPAGVDTNPENEPPWKP